MAKGPEQDTQQSSNRLLFRGVPAQCTSQAVQELLQQFGPVDKIFYSQGQGCGVAEFRHVASAEKAAANRLVLRGATLETRRAMLQMPGARGAGTNEQAIVTPAQVVKADIVVLRGAATATAIGIVYELAKAGTTTLVMWDRQHYAAEEKKVSSYLPKREFAADELKPDKEGNVPSGKRPYSTEGEKPDLTVISRAYEYFGAGQKCAFIHVCSDKLKQANKIERPLWHADEVIKGIAANQMETVKSIHGLSVFHSWVHATRACCFLIIPPAACWEYADDLCMPTVGLRRIAYKDPLRIPDGAGWTIGLQLTSGSSHINAALAYSAIATCVYADEGSRHHLSGKTLNITMPLANLWLEQKAEPIDAMQNGAIQNGA